MSLTSRVSLIECAVDSVLLAVQDTSATRAVRLVRVLCHCCVCHRGTDEESQVDFLAGLLGLKKVRV